MLNDDTLGWSREKATKKRKRAKKSTVAFPSDSGSVVKSMLSDFATEDGGNPFVGFCGSTRIDDCIECVVVRLVLEKIEGLP